MESAYDGGGLGKAPPSLSLLRVKIMAEGRLDATTMIAFSGDERHGSTWRSRGTYCLREEASG
jgi:hypothetical protein